MNAQDTPFGGLDKLLLSPTQAKKANQGKAEQAQEVGVKIQKKLSVEKKRKAEKTISDKPVNNSIRQTAGPLVAQSVDQPTDQSTDRSTGQLTGPVVERPVSFYIPKIIHKKIDEAVMYLQKNHSKKIDRSAVVSALLGDHDIWTPEFLDKLTKKVLDQLTNRLTSRLTS